MSPQLYPLAVKLRTLFSRHYAVLYVCVIGLLLAFAVFSLYQVLLVTSEPSTASNTSGAFDQSTIKKINALNDSTEQPGTFALPSPRPNPFVE